MTIKIYFIEFKFKFHSIQPPSRNSILHKSRKRLLCSRICQAIIHFHRSSGFYPRFLHFSRDLDIPWCTGCLEKCWNIRKLKIPEMISSNIFHRESFRYDFIINELLTKKNIKSIYLEEYYIYLFIHCSWYNSII